MLTYVLRKLAYMPFILLGVIAITFLLFTISTRPEALATIQLGEKATSRSKYEWCRSKGMIRWTERGTEKLLKMDRGDLPTRTTPLFNAATINDLSRQKRELEAQAEQIARLSGETESERAKKASYADKVFNNQGQIDAMLRAARTIWIIEKIGQATLSAATRIEHLEHDVEAAQEALAEAEKNVPDSDKATEARQALEAARQALEAATASSPGATKAYQAAVAESKQVLQSVDDIPPDLEYTSTLVMFGNYLKDLITLDFGDTRTGRPVAQVLGQGMWPSLSLALPAFLLAELIALFFGLLAAMYRKSRLDKVIVVSSILLMSINAIAIIIAGQKFLASDMNYFPISGYAGGLGAVRFLMLPALLYVVLSFGDHVRFNRIVMLDEVGQDYVRTARAKGLNENTVLFKHVLRNTLIPLITRWVVAIPTLYTGSLVLESFFGIPGLGYLTVDAIANSDGNVIRAVVFIGAVSFMLANLLSDVLYAIVDPRIRLN